MSETAPSDRTVRAEPSPLSGPVAATERIEALDVLRGFALLGILVMNIQSFAMPEAAYMNPHAWGDLSGINYVIYLAGHLLADQRMMAIFSMLFGAGIVMMTGRRSETGHSPRGLHYRRMVWLAVFGLLHAYLVWYGDILFIYAVCGMLLYPLRNLRPVTLVMLGVGALFFGSLLWWSTQWATTMDPAVAAEMAREFQPDPAVTEQEIAAYRGSWVDQMEHRAPTALLLQTFILLWWSLWRAGGMMLLGMAFYKVGVLTAEAPRRSYFVMMAAAVGIGLPLAVWGILWSDADGDVATLWVGGMQFVYWASALVALGWVGVVMWVCRSGALPRVRARLGAVGRMALTNYLMQSVLATLVFYGHGLGLFASVERWGQAIVVLLIWAAQLAWSPWWLARFRFGPAEWLWRTLSYQQWQPMRRGGAGGG